MARPRGFEPLTFAFRGQVIAKTYEPPSSAKLSNAEKGLAVGLDEFAGF